ncbi:hypothetical protein D9613_012186 [Agrocybe pediades]|uniref:XPG-I domain-containing protein n=1 Tax=Agrocybe pediades TaxID=84607 RepID=A0A8H4VTE2_9AGAR|nr:hypothetical protein D9613_012186 [Agrocybe pediades]
MERQLWWISPSKEMIQAFGYYVHQAPGEAEAELAYFNKHGIIDAVITSDGDAIFFGARVIYKHIPKDERSFDDEVCRFVHAKLAPADLSNGSILLLALLCGGTTTEVYRVDQFGRQTTLALARCGFGESLFEAFTRLGVEDFRNFVTVWRADLRIQLRTNSQGFLRGRRPLLADKIPDNFPSREVIDLYINPVTSWSTATLASIPVRALWRPRSPTIPAVALACMKNLGWDFGTLIKNFTKLWPGMFLQMIYSPLAIYDRSRRLLATPTTQAVILAMRSKPRKGQYALKYGDNHLVQFSLKPTNFVALVASLFDGIGTIVPVKEHTTVWLPLGYSIREGLFPAGFLPGVPTLGPGVLQLTTRGGSNSNEAQASASSRRKGVLDVSSSAKRGKKSASTVVIKHPKPAKTAVLSALDDFFNGSSASSVIDLTNDLDSD